MKPHALPAFAALAAIMASGLHAKPTTYLLTVNVANPTAVVFSATGATPNVDNSSYTTFDGILLASFFPDVLAEDNGFSATSSSLIPAGAASAYGNFYPDNYSGTWVDLDIYRMGGTETQTFITTSPAFTGAMTGDFSGLALPSPGYTGSILIGYYDNGEGTPGPVIGQYQVIPEPAHAGLLAGLAGLGSLLWLRRKTKGSA